MRRIQRLVLAAAAFLVLPCMATPSVEIKIRSSDVSEGVVVDVAARNTGDQVIYLLRSQTPFGLAHGKLQGDWFDVRDSDGQPVRYRGRQIPVRDPGRDAFVELVPGESIESRVDLAIEYDIPSDARLTIATQVVTYTALPTVLAHGETSLAPGHAVRSNTIEVSTARALGTMSAGL